MGIFFQFLVIYSRCDENLFQLSFEVALDKLLKMNVIDVTALLTALTAKDEQVVIKQTC